MVQLNFMLLGCYHWWYILLQIFIWFHALFFQSFKLTNFQIINMQSSHEAMEGKWRGWANWVWCRKWYLRNGFIVVLMLCLALGNDVLPMIKFLFSSSCLLSSCFYRRSILRSNSNCTSNDQDLLMFVNKLLTMLNASSHLDLMKNLVTWPANQIVAM